MLLVAVLAVPGCDHGEPAGVDPPDPLGPATQAVPRRLTFNPGDDRSPAATGTDILYSRYDPARGTSAQCLAALPADGGTIRAAWCPPDPSPADTFVSTWLEPTLADDGSALAFVWQRGPRVSGLAAWSHHLVVAPAATPAAPAVQIFLADSLGGALYNTASELSWSGPTRIRLLAAYESIVKVKGGGPDRFTDTTLLPRGLLELDLAGGTLSPVPGGAGVNAYAAASGGGIWVVRADTLWTLDPAGTAVPVLEVGPFVSDIAEVDGRIVAARLSLTPGDDLALSWWDPATGVGGVVPTPGPVHRLAPAAGRRFVAEVEADSRLFGAPANLWLFELPVR
jgi:hypothetical protein